MYEAYPSVKAQVSVVCILSEGAHSCGDRRPGNMRRYIHFVREVESQDCNISMIWDVHYPRCRVPCSERQCSGFPHVDFRARSSLVGEQGFL